MKYYSVRLKGGVVIQVREDGFRDPVILRSLQENGWHGDERFYMSESKGMVLIEDMQSTHLRNAILKMAKEWINSLYSITDPIEFVEKYIEGNPDKTFIAMVEELSERDE